MMSMNPQVGAEPSSTCSMSRVLAPAAYYVTPSTEVLPPYLRGRLALVLITRPTRRAAGAGVCPLPPPPSPDAMAPSVFQRGF